MHSWKTSTALAGVGACLASFAAQAAETKASDLLSLSLEELSNVQITSVSKRSEKASEAAAAVFVITQEDIRRSGMTSIPELLRMVPGLNVAQSGSHQWAVSSRGLSGQFADTLLVLIDGRTVYTPLFSGVFWDIQDTPLHDIDRIEVIRGPGATLWGANAVNGVINIITKHAKDTQGGYLSQSAGSLLNSGTTARYGAKVGSNAHARVYAKYDDYDEFKNMVDNGAHDPWNKAQGGFRVDWKNSENKTFTLQGDLYRSGSDFILNLIQPGGTTSPSIIRDTASGANILGRWNQKISSKSELTVQGYYDDVRRDNFIYKNTIQTADLDIQHVWMPSDKQEIVWGGGYRLVKSDFLGNSSNALSIPYLQILPRNQSKHLFSAFAQDKITLNPNDLFLTVGSKFEHNAFTGFEYQPSARLSWLVDEKQTLWASVARAVRTPNIGSTSDLQQIAAPTLLPGPTLAFLTQVGNANGKSEELNAYEIGYRVQPQKNLSIDTSLFYNDYRRMIIGVAGTPFVEPVIGYLIVPISPQNIGTAHTWGGEATAKWHPTSSLELVASYTLLQMKFDQPDPLGYNFAGKSPQQQFNASATVQLPHNVEFTASAYYVDELTSTDFNTGFGISDYTRLDLRLSWQPMDNIEVSLVGQNLLEKLHQEFAGFAYQNSSQVPRSVYGNIIWKF